MFALSSGIGKYIRFAAGKDAEKYNILPKIHLIVGAIAFLGFEINFQLTRHRYDALENEAKTSGKPITEKQFEERILNGEKLWILDDLVLDLSRYADYHPGGKFLIERTVGRDISKFFYGSYALDGNSGNPKVDNERHAHSNIARKIIPELIVGTLVRSTPAFEAEIDHTQSMSINKQTSSLVLVQKGPPAGVWGGLGLSLFYDDLSFIGKHFLIWSDLYQSKILEKFRVHR